MSQPEVRRASPTDRAQVVDTVEAAFVHDPAFGYFVGQPTGGPGTKDSTKDSSRDSTKHSTKEIDYSISSTEAASGASSGPQETDYSQFARTFAGFLFDQRVTGGAIWIAEGGQAVAMWDAPRRTTPSQEREQAGPYGSLDPAIQARLAAYDAQVNPVRPTAPHWYLGVLARHPEIAGRGWGRAVMSAGLAAAAADQVDAYLETSNDANVALYERAGWQVAGHAQVDELPIWVMRHAGDPTLTTSGDLRAPRASVRRP